MDKPHLLWNRFSFNYYMFSFNYYYYYYYYYDHDGERLFLTVLRSKSWDCEHSKSWFVVTAVVKAVSLIQDCVRLMIGKITWAFKLAIGSGKIYFVGAKPVGTFDYDFGQFINFLNTSEWEAFEEKEKQFRAEISSKRINHGDFICRGNVELWFNLLKILVGIFYQDNTFLRKKRFGGHWSINFQRYVCRILRTFPRDVNYRCENENCQIDYIHKQLEYIRQTIRPFFALKASNHRNANNAVPRDKLTDLWVK